MLQTQQNNSDPARPVILIHPGVGSLGALE